MIKGIVVVVISLIILSITLSIFLGLSVSNNNNNTSPKLITKDQDQNQNQDQPAVFSNIYPEQSLRTEEEQQKNPFVFVCGGYKTATTTLCETFNCEKTHRILDIPEDVDILLVPFRMNENVYPSAYFQIMTSPASYWTSPFAKDRALDSTDDSLSVDEMKDIILNTDANVLWKDYSEIDWSDGLIFDNKMRLEQINNIYNIDIDYLSTKLQIFQTDDCRIIAFNIAKLNDIFGALKRAVFGIDSDVSLKMENIGTKKWYSIKYKEFLDLVKNNTKVVPKFKVSIGVTPNQWNEVKENEIETEIETEQRQRQRQRRS